MLFADDEAELEELSCVLDSSVLVVLDSVDMDELAAPFGMGDGVVVAVVVVVSVVRLADWY